MRDVDARNGMSTLSPGSRVLRALATLAALAVLMLVVADWGWRWFGPAPRPAPPIIEVDQAPAAALANAPWFGASNVPRAASNTNADPTGMGDTRLLGTISGRDGRGYALFRLPDRGPVLVAVGQELAPGVKLETITAAGARISDRGELRDIVLRPTSSVAPKSSDAPRAAVRSNACVPPGAAGIPIYRLNAELLTGIAAKPDSWSTAFGSGPDGLTVREGNAFAAMLGMRAGDRVTQANGLALHGPDDVLVAVIRPLVSNQSVRVSGVRAGKPIEWMFVNASTCPA